MTAGGPPTFAPMSTRLFPKAKGADAYVVNGIAARCDWVVLSDKTAPHAVLVRRVDTDAPRHVFLSLRHPFHAIAFFWEHVLPRIGNRFVLVSGSEDVTVPRQLDQRWRSFDAVEQARLRAIRDDPRLLHWFAENLDDDGHARVSPLPVGQVFAQPPYAPVATVPAIPSTAGRPSRILCAHRTREGPQWDLRREVSRLGGLHPETCTVLDDELTEREFIAVMREHAFVLCVSGGGLDPSPKAWLAMLHGTIPIVCAGPLREAYARLPVAFVPRWDASVFAPGRLAAWHAALAGHHDVPARRAETLRRLGLDYWWDQVVAMARAPARRQVGRGVA